MVKKGEQFRTKDFGDDAEEYLGRLLVMRRNLTGSLMPDLSSINGRYSPELRLEVKAGKDGKVSLTAYQMHYSITSREDYKRLFGEDLPDDSNPVTFSENPLAVYYAIASRSGELGFQDMEFPYGRAQIEWNEIAIVPSDLVTEMFVITESLRSGVFLGTVRGKLMGRAKEVILENHSHYKKFRADKHDWQSFHLSDINCIFDESSPVAKGAERRIELLQRNYGGLDELRRISISAPGESQIRVLAKPEHFHLFDVLIRRTVMERFDLMEEVVRERRESRGYFDRMDVQEEVEQGDLFGGNSVKKRVFTNGGLTTGEKENLERICHWIPKNDPLESEFGN